MTNIYINTFDELTIGEITTGLILIPKLHEPGELDIIQISIKILKVATEEEYVKFLDSDDLWRLATQYNPYKSYPDLKFYYVEVLD